jgi:hypothetical protein
MVLLLNLLQIILIAVGIYSAWRYKNIYYVIGTLVILFILQAAQPSYLPKGEIERSDIAEFEDAGRINDLQPKPVSGSDRDKNHEEAVKRGLIFLQDKQVKSTTEEIQ